MSTRPTPQDLVERALQASTADQAVVLVSVSTTANLRWANNTLTTNGMVDSMAATVISIVGSGSGCAAGVVSGNVGSLDQLLEVTAAADDAARQSGPAPDADDLAAGDAASDWDEPPGETSIEMFTGFAAGLGEAFGRARDADRVLYGYVEHDMTTTYLGSSTGLRLRHQQPTGHVGITGKDASLTRSAWTGAATRDFDDVDALVLDAELHRRLSWAGRHVDLPAGRYDTILPPAAVADLQIYAHWSAAARDADDGRSVYSRPGGGTRVGEQMMKPGVRILSDPAYPGLECQPFVTASASSAASSVFDNGLPVARTQWVSDGRLAALLQTRESARDRRCDGDDRRRDRPDRARAAADLPVVHPCRRRADAAAHRTHPRRRLPGRARRGDRSGEQLPLQRVPDRPAEQVRLGDRFGAHDLARVG
jgi:predicted Zn-dependent protease